MLPYLLPEGRRVKWTWAEGLPGAPRVADGLDGWWEGSSCDLTSFGRFIIAADEASPQ